MMFIHVSEREFFSKNCSRFAIECDWNSKIPQSVQNLGFFGKINVFFSKKNLKFSKIANGRKFAVEWVSNGMIF